MVTMPRGTGREIARNGAVRHLAATGVRVRQRGSEHITLGTMFDYRQTQVNELYRQPRKGGMISHRCYRCATEDGMGLCRSSGRARTDVYAGPCAECDRVVAARNARLSELMQEEEEIRFKEENSIQRRRAKEKRQGYSNMFKPAALQPLTRLSVTSSGDSDAEDSESNDVGSDEEVLLPPPKQLDSLLPLQIGSKQEFIKVIKGYRKHRRKFERLKTKNEMDRRRKQMNERQRTASAEIEARHEGMIRGALLKMANRQKYHAFQEWRANVAFLKHLNLLTCMSSTRLLSLAWRAWRQVFTNGKLERYVSTVYIQCWMRRVLAMHEAARLRHQWRATVVVQRFGRSLLAKNIAKLAQYKRRKQERMIAQSLLQLADNRARSILFAWKRHVLLMKRVGHIARRSVRVRLQHFFFMWKRNAATLHRIRFVWAVATLQRIGRGMVGRIQARRRRREHAAAMVIQDLARERLARNMLRRKLRQRRVVRRKLVVVLGKQKASRFNTWKIFIRQKKLLRMMIKGSKMRTMQFFFEKWSDRRLCAADVQRVFRGFKGRQAAMCARHNMLSEIAKFGCGSAAQRECLEQLLDQRFQSTLLTKKRHNLLMVKRLGLIFKRRKELAAIKAKEEARGNTKRVNRKMFVWELRRKRHEKRAVKLCNTSNISCVLDIDEEERNDEVLSKFSLAELQHPDEIVMDVHGKAKQRFLISTHASFLEEVLTNEIEREIKRLTSEVKFQRQLLKTEAEQWSTILTKFLGKEKHTHLEDFKSYHKAGKSFDITITSHEDARETIATWKEMFSLQYITRWTIISWIAEGLLMKKGTRIAQRIIVWEVMQELFERSLMEDIAAFILTRYADAHTL